MEGGTEGTGTVYNFSLSANYTTDGSAFGFSRNILADIYTIDYEQFSFDVQAIPEPSSLILAMAGAAPLLLRHRRNFKK